MNVPQIVFMQPVVGLRTLDDLAFLRSITWSRSASARLIESARAGDVDAVFRELKKQGFAASSRKQSKKADSRRGTRKAALWSLNAFDESPRTAELASLWQDFELGKHRAGKKIGAKHKKKKNKNSRKHEENGHRGSETQIERLGSWLQAAAHGESLSPFELLLAFEVLREAGSDLPTEVGWPLWRLTLAAAVEASAGCAEPADHAVADDQTLVARGEIPFEAGLLFSAVKGSGKLNRTGGNFLRCGLEGMTDTDGTPKAELLTRISHWLAPLVRAAAWSKRSNVDLWDGASRRRFALLLEWVAAMCRTDGHLALSNGSVRDLSGLLSSASRLAGWKKKSPPAKYLSALGNGALRTRAAVHRKQPQSDDYPATQSDWARLACMRNSWSITPDTLVVAHHREKPLLDLTALGRPLLSGQWDISVVIDGRPIAFRNDWECVCWFSDDDADFLELHATPEPGVTIERQLMLSRTEHFAVLADAVSAPDGSRVEYKSRVPLVEGVESKSDRLTREWMLKTNGLRARVFPLALPDDRIESASGSLASIDGALELCQNGEGGLFAPLAIDWAPERRHSAADWRSLTVTEEGKVIGRSQAGRHRIRIGDHHLFIYRSLKSTGELRAVLGQHTLNETVIGLIDEDGDVDPILLVEPQTASTE